MCMPAIAFGGELQMWAYLSDKTAGEKIEEYLETLLTETGSLSRPPSPTGPLPHTRQRTRFVACLLLRETMM